jgi:hypothetical protein
MTEHVRPHDVYLSFTHSDIAVASGVAKRLIDSGLAVFSVETSLRTGVAINDVVRSALESASAFVMVYSDSAAQSPWLQLELGAAWGWGLPTFAIWAREPKAGEAPHLSSLVGQQIYTPSSIDQMVHEIQQSVTELDEGELDTLYAIYKEHGVPTDRLAHSPADAGQLASAFRDRTGRKIKPERLVRVLIRQRKQGKLPRLRE